MLGSELANVSKGLRRWVYSTFGTLDVDEKIWYWHYRKYFFPILRSFPSARILDAGCGEGLWSFHLACKFPQHQIVGIDIRHDAVDFCDQIRKGNTFPNTQFQVLPFTEIAFDQEFDIILSFFSLHYSYETDVDILRLFAKALKPEGWLLLTVPVAPVLWKSQSKHQVLESGQTNKYGNTIDFDEFKNHYFPEQLSRKLARAGFLPQQFHRLVGRLGQWSKAMNASASHHLFSKLVIWPLATVLGRLDTFLPVKNGMIWLTASRKSD